MRMTRPFADATKGDGVVPLLPEAAGPNINSAGLADFIVKHSSVVCAVVHLLLRTVCGRVRQNTFDASHPDHL